MVSQNTKKSHMQILLSLAMEDKYENFEKYWDRELKPFAAKCAKEGEKGKDPLAAYFIEEMIFYVEHDLADGRNPAFRMLQVKDVLNEEGYYRDVFGGIETYESRDYRELGKMVGKGLGILRGL
jgi:hypothetical protein